MYLGMKKEELKETAQDARRALERERERMMEEVERVEGFLRVVDATDELLVEVDRLNEELAAKDEEMENLHQQLQEEKERNQALEMKMAEMSKLSAGCRSNSYGTDKTCVRTITSRSTIRRRTSSKRN
jgi:predicted RNase H-like nuclease (RuvC/YqgF family)